MSTSLLTDRALLYTGFLDTLNRMAATTVWAASGDNPDFESLWGSASGKIEQFPAVRPFKEFPFNYLRRLNEFVWDLRQTPPSRVSMWQHVRRKNQNPWVRALKVPARLVAAIRAERLLESNIEKLLLGYQRSPEAVTRLKDDPPSVVITTGPYQFEQPAVVAAAKNLGIPTLAMIPSWDNISTKNRMVFTYDGFIVWSDERKQELHKYYPYSKNVPVYVVGAPQFDVFFQDRFVLSREELCASQGLRADLPIVVYAVGSPNFIQEHHGALFLSKLVERGDLGDVQLIVRPHPIHNNRELARLFGDFGPRVVLQEVADPNAPLTLRSQDLRQVAEWVNTFRHADVVINLSSTVTIDAAIFDRPVVNLDYDPEPGRPNQALVKDINHVWTHFKPIAESGGIWLVNNGDEMVEAVKTYLRRPELHRNERRWIAEHVCGFLDGRCGERLAGAIVDFVEKRTKKEKTEWLAT